MKPTRSPLTAAFQPTEEDIMAVAATIRHALDYPEAETLLALHVLPASGRIARAALHGNDLDQQTQFAHLEILAVLREAKVF